MAKVVLTNLDALIDSIVSSNVDVATANQAVINAVTAANEASTSESNIITLEASTASSALSASDSAQDALTYSLLSLQYSEDANDARIEVQGLLDTFDDRWLGAHAFHPVLDHDGDALVEGSLYWNSTDKVLYIFNGGGWTKAYEAVGFLSLTENLADVADKAVARTNLDIYSTSETDLALDTKYDKAGGTISGDVVISGSLLVNGETTTVNSTTVTTADNTIVINEGEVGAGVTSGEAGLEIDRGTETNYKFIFDELTDSFRVGVIGAEQAVATREDTPLDTGLATWDAINTRFTTTRDIDVDSITVSGLVDGRDVSVDGIKLDTIEENAKDDQLASEVPYINTTSGLVATEVQSAIDEVEDRLDAAETKLSGIEDGATADQLASEVPVTPIGNLTSTDVQSGLQELQSDIDNITDGTTLDDRYVNTAGDTMTGDLTVLNLITAGNVDGRDVSVDGSKLDTIVLSETAVADTTVKRDTNGNIADYYGAIGRINSPLLDLPLVDSLDFERGNGTVTFERASTATYIDRYGVLKYVVVDEPRFEKDGLLIEGASTNYILNSDTCGTTSSNSWGTITTSLEVCPDGVSRNVLKLTSTAVGQIVRFGDLVSGIANQPYSGSIYIKTDTAVDVNIDINNSPADILSITNEFHRYSKTSATDNTYRFMDITSRGIGDVIYLCFVQLEALPFATSYIPTTTSAVTRSADVCYVENINNVPHTNTGEPQMSIAIESDVLGLVHDTSRVLVGQYYSSSNYWYVKRYSLDGRSGFASEDGLNVVSHSFVDTDTDSVFKKNVFIIDNADAYIYTNGVVSSTSPNTMTTDVFTGNLLAEKIYIGSIKGTTSQHYGHIKNIKIYDVALNATEAALLGGNV